MELQNDFAYVLSRKRYRSLLSQKERVELLIELLETAEYYDSTSMGGPSDNNKLKQAFKVIQSTDVSHKEYERIIESEKPKSKMKNYRVKISCSFGTFTVEVTAPNEEEAEKVACEDIAHEIENHGKLEQIEEI